VAEYEGIRKHILEVLIASYLPLSISDIVARLPAPVGSFSPVPLEQTYSPHKRYEAGQRLFHPAAKYRSWFVVEEPMRDGSFIARFDSGKTRKLAHSDSKMDYYTFTAEYHKLELERLAEENLRQMSNVATIEGLFVLKSRLQRLPFHQLSNPRVLTRLTQLHARSRQDDRIDQLHTLCRRYKLTALYYLIPLENLPSIFERGILCKNLAPRGHASFANEDIQAKRHCKEIGDNLPLTLHDCVPLFFAPRPPLLYLRRDEQERLVYIRVNTIVLLEPGVVFSRVNAISAGGFFTDISDLGELDWAVLRAEYWRSDNEEQHRRNKLLRQAEAQIPVMVPVHRFLGLDVCDVQALQRVRQMVVDAGISLSVKRNRRLYC